MEKEYMVKLCVGVKSEDVNQAVREAFKNIWTVKFETMILCEVRDEATGEVRTILASKFEK